MITNAFYDEPLDLREEKIESARYVKFIGLTYWPPEVVSVETPGADPAIIVECKFEHKLILDHTFVHILKDHQSTREEINAEVKRYLDEFHNTGHIVNSMLVYNDIADVGSEERGVCKETVRLWRFVDLHPGHLCTIHGAVSHFYNRMIRAGDEPWTDPKRST